MADNLLDHLIQIGNEAGSIRPAPDVLKKLKKSLEGVPFDINVPSMSGVISASKMLSSALQLIQSKGDAGAAGNLGNVLAPIQTAINQAGGDIKNLDPNVLASKIDMDALSAAVGDAMTLGLSLVQFGGGFGPSANGA